MALKMRKIFNVYYKKARNNTQLFKSAEIQTIHDCVDGDRSHK